MWLDEKLIQQLKNVQASLSNQGRVYSKAQFDGFCATFRRRFGPDRLSTLDGEALLETMHSHGNRDSLVYWLEFKDDEELPAIFGSILGGSALKFGLFRRRETGAWTTGSSKNQREISVEEAIQIARKHRDQLLKGVELLEKLSANASDAEYIALQQDMDELAPDVSDLAWGHKYFSLIYPDKLDNYHSPVYQRFHLIKLLQTPPGEGRYAVAGRFVNIARELDLPVHQLTKVLNYRNKDPYRYWRIGTRSGTSGQSYWELMRDGNYVSVGWRDLGDLSWLTHDRQAKEKLRGTIQSHYPNTPQAIGRQTQQLFDFKVNIQERDLVLASDGRNILGVGHVVGEYNYEPALDFPHRRPVEWLYLDEWQLPETEGLQTTVYELGKHIQNLNEIERRILDAAPIKPASLTFPAPGSKQHSIPRLEGIPGHIQTVLERKGQVILYGPPGTGKTYWAMQAAYDLAAYNTFGVAFDKLTDAQRVTIIGDLNRTDGLVRMCSFHPAYGYEDFFEGYKPVVVNQQLAFEKHAGIFKRLCTNAQEKPDQRFYLIIDEINRGDIPRIFGELITVLEKDKRGKAIFLPLSDQPFHVPENVYVIGTMNTADRSIALLDTALRRRFGFVELMPNSSVLGDTMVGDIPLGPWLDALNRRLCGHIGRDARNLQIGHAYFLVDGKPVADFSQFAHIVQDDIVPLLEEYCYEDFTALVKILGSGLVDEANQCIRHELFASDSRYELIQALLLPCPEITTSVQAVTSAESEEGPEEAGEEEDEG